MRVSFANKARRSWYAPAGTSRAGRRRVLVSRGSARNRRKRSNGFTVLELLIVVAIVLTISAIAVPNLMAAIDQARIARAVGDIHAIEDDVASYQAIYRVLPDSLSQMGDGNLLDPWGNPYQYLNHVTMKGNGQARKDRFLVPLNSDYDLYSMGKDVAGPNYVVLAGLGRDGRRARAIFAMLYRS